MSKTKVPVSTRALVQRINRLLAKERKTVKACRPNSRSHDRLGDFYLLDTHGNNVVEAGVSLEALGRKLGVLGAWETWDAGGK